MSFSKPLSEPNRLRTDGEDISKSSARCSSDQDASRPSREYDEISVLKDLVKSLELKCLRLLSYVEDMDKGSHPPADTAAIVSKDFGLVSNEGSSNAYQRERDVDRKELEQLKSEIRELVDKNLKWQEYHNERKSVIEARDKRVQELSQEVQELKQRLLLTSAHQSNQMTSSTSVSSKLAASRQIEVDNLLLQQKGKVAALEDARDQLLDENHKLKREIQELQERLRGVQPAGTSPGASAPEGEMPERELALKEENELLQMQLLVHREDFESERQDRARAQQRVDELERQLNSFLKETIQSRLTNASSDRHHPQLSNNHNNSGNNSLIPRQRDVTPNQRITNQGTYHFDGHDELDHFQSISVRNPDNRRNDPVGFDQTDCYPHLAPVRDNNVSCYQTDGNDDSDCEGAVAGMRLNMVGNGPNTGSRRNSVLSCPRCLKSFSMEDHVNLIEHMEDCV